MIAATAQTLSIGPTSAALERGTQVRWRRDKRKLSVTQPRGNVMVKEGETVTMFKELE